MTEETILPNNKRLCACGCGQEVKGFTHTKPPRPVLFKKGHNNSKERHWQWKGGRKLNQWGYVMIQAKDHPRATKEGYVFEHILVMEKHIRRYLLPNEVIHHINGVKTDNRLENLRLFSNHSEHLKVDKKKDMSGRRCIICGSSKTRIDKPAKISHSYHHAWYGNESDGFVCHHCYGKRKSVVI